MELTQIIKDVWNKAFIWVSDAKTSFNFVLVGEKKNPITA